MGKEAEVILRTRDGGNAAQFALRAEQRHVFEACAGMVSTVTTHRNHAKAPDFGRDVAITPSSARSVSWSRASYIYIDAEFRDPHCDGV